MNLLLRAATLAVVACPSWLAAAELAKPTGPVILVVTGAIENTNGEGAAAFDLAMLEALPGRTTTAKTPWYDETKSFSGPLIQSILDAVGAHGEVLKVTAINNYSAELPVQEARDYPVIFATRLEEETMSIRERGPIFVIYPFDESPELYDEAHFGRSVWQVTSLDVR